MKVQLKITYQDIISLENLFAAWKEFVCGKRKKKDVQEFGRDLVDNITILHEELATKTYKHGGYQAFNISDPKPRNIHKASVRDRLLHHAIYRQLYPFFDPTFIADSFSCRVGKGVHRALNRFRKYALKVSKNNTKTAWVLKLDVKKFFASIDHGVLLTILKSYIPDQNILWLLERVIESFSNQPPLNLPLSMSTWQGEKREKEFPPLDEEGKGGVGLPLGNLTSQLFCNIYMNELDQFVKLKLKVKYYLRYADDFVMLSVEKEELLQKLKPISVFLSKRLHLSLHPQKVILKTFSSGVDFLGWEHFSKFRVMRSLTKRRMFKRIAAHPMEETLQSYLGLLSHGNGFKLRQKLISSYWLEAVLTKISSTFII